nr:MAG TPA: hypothetical protein [Caudoviricetes sp.]
MCKARRRPQGLTPVLCTNHTTKGSQIGSQQA